MITGYRKFRSISDNDLAYLRVFMLIRAMVSIGWYSARPEVTAGSIVLPHLIDYVRSNAVRVMASHGIFIKPMPGI
jgi:Ser/Thr protein kinase RdoA (MazF antagonist)